jgi:hypothetical protein
MIKPDYSEFLDDKDLWDDMRESLAERLKEIEERDTEPGVQHPNVDDYIEFVKFRTFPGAVEMDKAKADKIAEHIATCSECAKLFSGLEFRKELSEAEKGKLIERRNEIRKKLAEEMKEIEWSKVEVGEHPTADELLAYAAIGFPGIEPLSMKRVDEITEHLKHCRECYELFRSLDDVEEEAGLGEDLE